MKFLSPTSTVSFSLESKMENTRQNLSDKGIHGLENIQIRLIPAKELYDHYLSQGKIDIGRLEL